MKSFYVHIDAIFDVRQGVINRLNPEIGANLVRNNHHKRKGDFWEGIDPAEYKKLHNKYEVETLQHSTITNVFQFLYPQLVDVLKEASAREVPIEEWPTVDVNIWPYELEYDEIGMLKTLIHASLGGIVGVNVFSKPISELDPTRCFANYFAMVMYCYDQYLNAHSDALIKNPVVGLILTAPMVYFNKNPDTDEEVIEHLKRGINSLSLLEAAVAPRIKLMFVDIDVFSILYPDDRVSDKGTKVDTSHHHSIEELDRVLAKQKEQDPT